jgi:hypothetical protein
MDFICYYCNRNFTTLNCTKDHVSTNHPDKPPKCRQLVLNEKKKNKTNGETTLVTKLFRTNKEKLRQTSEEGFQDNEEKRHGEETEKQFELLWPSNFALQHVAKNVFIVRMVS